MWNVQKLMVSNFPKELPQKCIKKYSKKSRVFQWLLEETFDAKGNYIVYQYKPENTENISNNIYEVNRTQTANKYIERIKYGRYQSSRPPLQERDVKEVNWHFEVVFDYGEYDIDFTNPTP